MSLVSDNIILLVKKGKLMLDVCIGCNENEVTWDALYCLNCYLAKNSEIDYAEIDKLWTIAEAK